MLKACAIGVRDGPPAPNVRHVIGKAEIDRTFAVLRANPEARAKREEEEEEVEEETQVINATEMQQRGRWRFADFDTVSVRRRGGGRRKTGSAVAPSVRPTNFAESRLRAAQTAPISVTATAPGAGAAAAASGSTLPPLRPSRPPIHGPLGAMGFSDELITMAVTALRVRPDDVSAATVNQCASWMIDHPPPDPAADDEQPPPPRRLGATASQARPVPLRRQNTHPARRENTAMQDIRSFFRRRIAQQVPDHLKITHRRRDWFTPFDYPGL